jgi:hypothetical protein
MKMETFEEKAQRLPQKIKDELESYMDVVLGISSLETYTKAIENELETRLENSKTNSQPVENVLKDLAEKHGLQR